MIVAFGTMALDTIETPAGGVTRVPGGSAVYFAAAASLLRPVAVLGVVGSDYPWSALDGLVARGVDLSGVERREGPTMTWRARYHADMHGRETLASDRGVAASGAPSVPLAWRGAATLFLGSTDPELQRSVLDRVAPKGLVVLDTMEHWIRDQRDEVIELAGRCHVLLVNAAEAALLAGEAQAATTDPRTIAHTLLAMGPQWVVVKQGPEGARAFSSSATLQAPAVRGTDPVDPTGAGDAFAGGLAARISGSEHLDAATMADGLLCANVVGALAVEDFGVAALSRARAPDLEGRVKTLRQRSRSARLTICATPPVDP